jgi:hypothetical protein
MIEYGKAMVPHKYPIVFLLIIDVWTANVFPTLKSTQELYSSVVFGLKRRVSR